MSSPSGFTNNERSEPQPCSSKSAQGQYFQSGQPNNPNTNIDMGSLIGSFLNSTGIESLASAFLGKLQPGGSKKSNDDLVQSISTKDDSYEIKLDVSNFAPEDIVIRVEDNCIFIEAKHEEKQDEYGFVSRQFVRRFTLPKGILLEMMYSEINSDNILVLTAPKHLEKSFIIHERSIPISVTN